MTAKQLALTDIETLDEVISFGLWTKSACSRTNIMNNI
jgi:hypothetical protein